LEPGNQQPVGNSEHFIDTRFLKHLVHSVINYSGTYQYNGNSYLAVYGWTRNSLIEYCESP